MHWLQCRYNIETENVIGHNESLSSPYHHEDVPSLRTQTHDDFDHRDMDIYRARLRKLGELSDSFPMTISRVAVVGAGFMGRASPSRRPRPAST